MPENSVLIVDADPAVKETAVWLKGAGFRVATAATGEEALNLIDNQDFSVMLLDMRLPGKHGLGVMREAKIKRPWLQTIVTTDHPSVESATEALRQGAMDYLVKPISPQDLSQLIKDTIKSASRQKTANIQIRAKATQTKILPQAAFVISRDSLKTMVNTLIGERESIGVKAKQGKFVYDKIKSFDELTLDYDVTVNPPTAFFIPACETILRYKMGENPEISPVTDNTQRVIIGVHPDDINAINLLDEVFMTNNPDPNYTARRENTLIIGVDVMTPQPASFAPSMGAHTADTGFDLLLTDIGNASYIVTVGSENGAQALARYAQVREPTVAETARQKQLRDEALAKYRLFLDMPRDKIPNLLDNNYDNPYWASRSETCLNCGSCIMVCPTCFCFDVQDDVSLNLVDGERVRKPDGCMLVDFSRVAAGANFRGDKMSRYRHRMYHKGKYILDRYGKFGCVGCGRCAIACLAEIASPLEAYNAIAASEKAKEKARRTVTNTRPQPELYLPHLAKIEKVTPLSGREKLFEFRLNDGNKLGHRPGQFIEVYVFGIGESPISLTSSPTRDHTFEVAVRNVGNVTGALHRLEEGASVGIRGPFGNGFPLEQMEGKDILFIAGGIGVFPLRSLIQYVLDRRDSYGHINLLFGARSPAERVFADEMQEWAQAPDVTFLETVDKGDDTWEGNVGVITTLIPKIQFNPKNTVAIVVGPPIMYRFVINELKKRDLADDNIIVSLERKMKCGVGKCGNCQINGVYVCQEGPVFSMTQLRTLREAI
ncbi:MAG: 4Fe-4S dicluster domain-containing protein [Dehalogenimonas sp.]|uniref:4Fe-4S dicluster domain-containing protein n=1 Tax=Candidatus Dehalogenimonas loeffleri TaxID=3127115 RepID=A0ABZ2J3J9_9CHLR|nr:4Fe-4S dicluster domain-containing protein [Dehalogenimonas sp.]